MDRNERRIRVLRRVISRHTALVDTLTAELERLEAIAPSSVSGLDPTLWRRSSHVTVSMPFYGCHKWVRRAVESILGQTHKDLTLVVVNDADPEPPWALLEDIDDPRLVRFDLGANHGRYFADAVIFEAFQPDWWAMQDPDDWSEPDRLEVMLAAAQADGMAVAGSRYIADSPAAAKHSGDLRRSRGEEVVVLPKVWPVPPRMRHYVGYGSAVIAGARIRAVGGFHPEVRLSYDTYLMNALRLTGGMGIVNRPLQNKLFRAGSLQTADETRQGTPERTQAQVRLRRLFIRARSFHSRERPIHALVRADCDPSVWAEMKREADRLRRQVQEVAA